MITRFGKTPDQPIREGSHVSEVLELRSGDHYATVDTTGAALRSLTWAGRDLVWPYSARPSAFQGQVLAPWPNRVREARYRFGGVEHRLAATEAATGAAMHGLVHDLVWEPLAVVEHEVRLGVDVPGSDGYPFPLRMEIGYRLDAGGLTVTTDATNTGRDTAPFGLGFHPYLTLGAPLRDLAARGEAHLSVPADRHQPVDDRLLPVGDPVPVDGGALDLRPPGRELGGTVLDTAFTGLERDGRGRAWVWLAGPEHRVGLWSDRSFGWVQLFSSNSLEGADHRAHLAVEPMTCPPDAFNSGTDLIRLAPGASTRHTFGITATGPGARD
ncbi:aldose 1-epimerase family protein [Nocardiopsis kunsanensis]|uniref:aldose 1-epimerase family protein n=1 Tax=Nocardiopsis kunsanensis TaxID=141693 RepID=UPI000366E55A|nr:aldose 1-epimerase family protein [Nocardiopsis kunsanensis]